MKTAITHISDFHIKENDHFIIEKIGRLLGEGLNESLHQIKK